MNPPRLAACGTGTGGVLGIGAGVTLINSNATDNVLERIDAILDDGNLSAGRFQRLGNGVTLILEP
jgi:hypothetical protein